MLKLDTTRSNTKKRCVYIIMEPIAVEKICRKIPPISGQWEDDLTAEVHRTSNKIPCFSNTLPKNPKTNPFKVTNISNKPNLRQIWKTVEKNFGESEWTAHVMLISHCTANDGCYGHQFQNAGSPEYAHSCLILLVPDAHQNEKEIH